MNISQRINAFDALGDFIINNLNSGNLDSIIIKAFEHNRWFTATNSETAIKNIAENFLQKEKLEAWISQYKLNQNHPITIGVVMAGNIPLVGWQDALAVLITGNKLLAKLSSKDTVLPSFFLNTLIEIEPEFKKYIETPDRLSDFDAVIATGSGNTARYFEYYFGKYPHIIRRNRTSVAVLNGHETKEQILNLGEDIFTYFGLGCRNVSHLYVPKGYNLTALLDILEQYKSVANHTKYFNNYEYYKSLLLLNNDSHLDNGFLILKEDNSLASPVSSIYFSYYENLTDLKSKLCTNEDQIQCIIGNGLPIDNIIPFGRAQCPQLNQYADNVDTIDTILQWQNQISADN